MKTFEERLQELEETKIRSFEIAKQSSIDINNVKFALFFIYRNGTSYIRLIHSIDSWGVGANFMKDTNSTETDISITTNNKKVTIQNNRESAVNVIMIYQ